MGFIDDLSNVLKRGITTIARKTDEYTKIGKIKVDIIGIKRDIDKKFNELGAKTYQLIVEQNNPKVAANEEVQKLIEDVKSLNKQLQDKKEELERVREEYAKASGKKPEEVDVTIDESEYKG